MDYITIAFLVAILLAIIFNSILQQKRVKELLALSPEAIEEPDYVGKFKDLGADALLEVLEKRKATVEDVVLEDLPLEQIKQQNLDIIAKFEELDELTKEFKKDNETTRTTTKGLSMALSVGIGERGNWGESCFDDILRMSQLVEGVNYLHDKPLTNSSNSKSRPDFTVMLADGSAIAIDSKALLGPLVTLYDQAMVIPSETERNAAFRAIADNIWSAIMDKPDGIIHREYPKRLEEHFGVAGPSFTVIFIPGDHILSMAYKNDKGHSSHGRKNVPLQEAAFLNGVLLATPTMAMALLTMIRGQWASYKIDEDTQKIQDLAVELYGRHVTFGNRLVGIGTGLKAATKSYGDAVTAYRGQQGIRNTGKKMVDAGIKEKSGNKELPEPPDPSEWEIPSDIDATKFPEIPMEENSES